jgi:hypothetical protein
MRTRVRCELHWDFATKTMQHARRATLLLSIVHCGKRNFGLLFRKVFVRKTKLLENFFFYKFLLLEKVFENEIVRKIFVLQKSFRKQI